MLNIDKSKFNKDQLNMITKCEEEGIDVSVINNPEYSEEQMKYILAGVKEGLDISCYNKPGISLLELESIYFGLKANPKMAQYVNKGYTPRQMSILSACLQDNIEDVDTIANPKYSYEQMNAFYLQRLNGIKVTKNDIDKLSTDSAKALINKLAYDDCTYKLDI